jgi:hypothetical protein
MVEDSNLINISSDSDNKCWILTLTDLELGQDWQQEAEKEGTLLQALPSQAAELRFVRCPIDWIQCCCKSAFQRMCSSSAFLRM